MNRYVLNLEKASVAAVILSVSEKPERIIDIGKAAA